MGWLDALNLGVDIVQAYQLHKIKDQVGSMQMGAMEESYRKELIAALKNMVFSVNQDLKIIQSKVDEYPKQVYVIAEVLDWRINYFGISPEIFPELPDKDYSQNVIQGIRETKYLASQHLDAETLVDAEDISKKIIEVPKVTEWMEYSEARKKISNLEASISELKSKNFLFGILGTLSLIIGLVLFCTFSIDGSSGSWLFPLRVIGLGIVLLALRKKNDVKELNQKLEKLKSSLPDQERVRELKNTCGNLSYGAAQAKKSEYLSVIQAFMGEFKGFESSKLLEA